MIEESFHNYIKDFVLKSSEELEWGQPNYDNLLLEAKIIKRSERTYRILGLLTLSIQPHKKGATANDHKLDTLKFTPRKKVNLDDDDRQTFRWLEDGWILKEVRFEKDEKTVRSAHYRMGFRLYQYEQLKLQQKTDQIRQEFLQLQSDILATLSTQVVHHGKFSNKKGHGLQNIAKIVNQLNHNELNASDFFPQKWHLGSRLKYLHFVNAFSQLCLHKKEFDWKEIGAAYFQKIGGSKEFDSYKQEFIDHLEEWANVPAVELGLTSLGQITPVFFAGQLSGKYASYDWGPVHALTNLSIANEAYRTKATTLWLVENRAILTRMAAAEDFLKETNSLVICVDGHLRSTHKNAIVQLLDNSDIKQVMIWCDYDRDGLQISKEIHTLVYKHNALTKKFILPEQQVICDWFQFEQCLINFLENNTMEQEQMMGGVDHWKKWIQD
ncbi:DUF2399 domain-containing protein [Bacillus sp. S3]|uniref:toprim domain-containing protein n=1 Tax=Bacillus sp. S3 TaxID=486398 RepID=UPI00118C2795|nr:toprim domain-containing protein [Bacillus sp. S3]QCJ41146.1 DUF2399 domain-containing protein [Bacillus sp. S3]